MTVPHDILEAASLRGPSVFNTQPWKWRIAGDAMPSARRPPIETIPVEQH